MTDPQVSEEILEKLRKIQGYTKSDNPNEAENAAVMLSQMLVKYNIDLSQIPEKERTRNPFVKETIFTDNLQRIPDWKVDIAVAVAKANLCRVIVSHNGKSFYILGRQSNVEATKFIYESTWRDLQMIADALWAHLKEILVGQVTVHGKTWKLQYLTGCADGVRDRLAAEVKKWRNDDAAVNALVVANDEDLAAYVRSEFPRLGTRYSNNSHAGGNAFGLGQSTGKNIQFKTGVGYGGASGPKQIKG